MDLDSTKRSVVAVAVALIVVIAVYLSVPPLKLAPQGIFLPTAPLASPTSLDQVNFYNPVTVPYVYKQLGYMNVEYSSKEATPEGEAQIQQYVKQMVSQGGANAIIVTLFGHTIPGTVKRGISSYIFRGIAIYAVPNI
ncbi:hypothetical protein B1F79_00335 [Coxiella-like endosymbiont of Rhipicephalus sanguineus]|uniref:hypothetical protein n=1 Tax=Coxiella-like endosymbiont of Rhipicephalus sanguineus TaxID=1955402 RepID=UPI00203DAD42|nr:hypothetical protein [Coxiella-like endosymbiont of Rhipicephalus sanguineus]MBT8506233.1 hypothetical protein [Coxiella-like endosymbiont of Rhipicephalus sanguineus]